MIHFSTQKPLLNSLSRKTEQVDKKYWTTMQPNWMGRVIIITKLEEETLSTSAEIEEISHYLVLCAVTIFTYMNAKVSMI